MMQKTVQLTGTSRLLKHPKPQPSLPLNLKVCSGTSIAHSDECALPPERAKLERTGNPVLHGNLANAA